jgi:hypothetical protein
MTALPRRPPRRICSSTCPAASRSTVERMRAVIVPSASTCTTLVSPSGEIRGFALEAWLCAVICRSANQPSSAAKIVETRRPPGRIISASRRMASGPLTRAGRSARTRAGTPARPTQLSGGERQRVAIARAGRPPRDQGRATGPVVPRSTEALCTARLRPRRAAGKSSESANAHAELAELPAGQVDPANAGSGSSP